MTIINIKSGVVVLAHELFVVTSLWLPTYAGWELSCELGQTEIHEGNPVNLTGKRKEKFGLSTNYPIFLSVFTFSWIYIVY